MLILIILAVNISIRNSFNFTKTYLFDMPDMNKKQKPNNHYNLETLILFD